jgi:hypothetical protein
MSEPISHKLGIGGRNAKSGIVRCFHIIIVFISVSKTRGSFGRNQADIEILSFFSLRHFIAESIVCFAGNY